MLMQGPAVRRENHTVRVNADWVVVGGGLAGVCAAITAARAGLQVVLIQDRPVLGGNASSEVRLWVLGATAHMYNNNRWAREGGVINEILVENLYRNPEGNPLIFDTVVLEWVTRESNIQLLLNTAVYEVIKHDADVVSGVRGFCAQNGTVYEVSAALFCDASGDGILGFLSGAAFRMGAEAEDEFGEKFAPSTEYGELLGHSMYFYSRDTGKPVNYVPPSFALRDITRIPRYRHFNTGDFGCRLWWIEYGGRLDTIHDTETIKWELWKIVYGVWDHIKNSGKFPEARNLTLEWVSTIPGKRESRRFEGDYILNQRDLIEQHLFADAVSFGGWSIDLHPADGVFSQKPGCNQWHSKGIYQIPYRCLYSRNIRNLFLAGRIISASHVAFGSTRVIGTCSAAAQAVGMAAAMCISRQCQPKDLLNGNHLRELQQRLLRAGQFIPHVPLNQTDDLARSAQISASSCLQLRELPSAGDWIPLDASRAMLLPINAGQVPNFTLQVQVSQPTTLRVELRSSSRPGNFTPDQTRASREFVLHPSTNPQTVEMDFATRLERSEYVFVCLMRNSLVQIQTSPMRISGVLSLINRANGQGSPHAQSPQQDVGVDCFEFWYPQRRPGGANLAMCIHPPLDVFGIDNLRLGYNRPTSMVNAWVADPADPHPTLTLTWKQPQTMTHVELDLDPDWDHPMESVLMGHPENLTPFCVPGGQLLDEREQILVQWSGQRHAQCRLMLSSPTTTSKLVLKLDKPASSAPVALFGVRCYSSCAPK